MTIPLGVGIQGSGIWQQVLDFEALIGRKVDSTRHYRHANEALIYGDITTSIAAGKTPLISREMEATGGGALGNGTFLQWADFSSGAHDALLAQDASALAALGSAPVFLVFAHEPENDPSGTAAQYVAAFKYYHDYMRNHGVGANVKIGPCYMQNTFSGGHGGIDIWQPTSLDSYCDFIASDQYTRAANSGQNWKTFRQLYTPQHDWIANRGKPWIVEETGCAEGATPNMKPDWFYDGASTLAGWQPPLLYMYSNVYAQLFNGQDYRVDTTPASLTAFKYMIGTFSTSSSNPVYPAGVPATSRWVYDAMHYGNIAGVQMGVDAVGSPWPGSAETFSSRAFYWSTALGSGQAPFNPTGKNQAGTLVETPVTQSVWNSEVNTPQAGQGTYPRTIDIAVTVLGIRTSDATWPGGPGGTGGTGAQGLAAINAWTLHDGSYVDTCVKAWATMMKTVTRATMVRLWHEQGNMLGGIATDPNFIPAWRKVFNAWVTLGAVYKPDLSDLFGSTPKCLVAWCPASHPSNPSSNVTDFPGTNYVHIIGRDIYNSQPTSSWGDCADLWYREFEPFVGPSNAVGRPLVAFEGGNETSDPTRIADISEWHDRLKGTSSQQHWDKISAFNWWGGAGNDLINTPAGFQTAWQSAVGDSYFLLNGITTVQNTPTVKSTSIDALKTKRGKTKTYNIDASKVKRGKPTYNLEVSLIRKRGVLPYSVDALKHKTNIQASHSVEALIVKKKATTHTLEAFLGNAKVNYVEGLLVSHRSKTSSLDAKLIYRRTQSVDSYLTKAKIKVTQSIDSLLRTHSTYIRTSSVDSFLVLTAPVLPIDAPVMYPTAKILRIISQNMNVAGFISTGDDVADPLGSNNSESLIDGYDRPSMRFAICDEDATTNDSYRVFPSIIDPKGDQYSDYQKIPWISTRTSSGGSFSPVITMTATYPFFADDTTPLQCNKIEVVTDPFGKNSAGVITNMDIKISTDGIAYTTIYSGLSGFSCEESYRPTIYLQQDNTTWGLNRADTIPSGISIYGLQIIIHSIFRDPENPVDRPLVIYEMDALREEDLTDYVVSLTVDEQRDLSSQTLSPLGASSANSLQMTLANAPSTLFSPIFYPTGFESNPSSTKDIDSVIIVTLGLRISQTDTEWYDYGKYVVDDWNQSSDLGQISIAARDYSRYLQAGKMSSMIYEDYTLDDVVQDVVERAGISDYEIDASIFGIEELATGVIKEFVSADEVDSVNKNNVIWTDGQTYWEFLQSIAFTDLGVFYFDKSNRFHYKTKEEYTDITGSDPTPVQILTEYDDIFSAGSEIQLMKNNITLQYSVPEMSDTTVGLWSASDVETISSTSLAAPIDSASDTILVGDISDWEKQGYFQIDNEIVKYQDRSDSAFLECERGFLGTVPDYHFVQVDTSKWNFAGGNWAMNGGVLEARNQGSDWGTAITVNEISGDGYNVEGDVTIMASPYKAGVVIKAAGQSKYYYFVMKSTAAPGDSNGVTGTDLNELYELWSIDQGNTTKLKTSTRTSKKILTNITAHFKVQVNDDELSLFIEETRVLTYRVKDTDVQVNYPAKIGFIARGKGPTKFDSLVVTKLADTKVGEIIVFEDNFGAPIYEIRRFDAEFETTPARSSQYFLTNNVEIEVLDYQPGPFRAVIYVKNKKDGISLISGVLPGSEQDVPEFFYIVGFAADHKTNKTLSKTDNKSINKYGSQELSLTLPWIQSESQAKGVLRYLIDVYKEPVYILNTQISPKPALQLGQIASIEPQGFLFDNSTGTIANRDFHITGINTVLSETGLTQTTTLRTKTQTSLIPVVNSSYTCSIAIPPTAWYTTDEDLVHVMPYAGYSETIYNTSTSPVTDADGYKVPMKIWRPSGTAGTVAANEIMAPSGSSSGGAFKTIIWGHEGFQSNYLQSSDSVDIKRWLTKIVRTGYNVIFVDYRGSGGYTRSYFEAFSYLNKDVDDMKSVKDWAAGQSFVDSGRVIIGGFSHGASMAYTAMKVYKTDFDAFLAICGTPNMGCAVQRGSLPQDIKDKIYISMGGPPDSQSTLWTDRSPEANYSSTSFTERPVLSMAAELDSFYDIKDVYSLDLKTGSNVTTYAYADQPRGWLFAYDGANATQNFYSDPWLKIMTWLESI